MLRDEFIKGEQVILDKEFKNSSTVEVISQTPKKLYSRVKAVGQEDYDSWDVMTYRLTKIPAQKMDSTGSESIESGK